jgi:hypothetical protein
MAGRRGARGEVDAESYQAAVTEGQALPSLSRGLSLTCLYRSPL